MPNTGNTDEFNAAIEEKVEEFKLTFIEQMKYNLRAVFKDDIREIFKEELKKIVKLSSTVSLFQKHVNTMKERERERERVMQHCRKDVKTLNIWLNAINNTFPVKKVKRRKRSWRKLKY